MHANGVLLLKVYFDLESLPHLIKFFYFYTLNPLTLNTMRSKPTSNIGLPSSAAPIDTSNANPQNECPLFRRIPGELRNEIFRLALTAYSGKQVPYDNTSCRCRPGFRYADVRIDTALLRTCRLVYGEARLVPQQNYVHVQWRDDLHSDPYAARSGRYIPGGIKALHPWLSSLHLFTLQYLLESKSLAESGHSRIRNLKMTIRHCDWTPWVDYGTLMLDAKQEGPAEAKNNRKASDDFDEKSWGRQFLSFKRLKTFELELETLEERRNELDGIAERAKLWRFPLRHGNVLALNPAKNKKTAWRGKQNCK